MNVETLWRVTARSRYTNMAESAHDGSLLVEFDHKPTLDEALTELQYKGRDQMRLYYDLRLFQVDVTFLGEMK